MVVDNHVFVFAVQYDFAGGNSETQEELFKLLEQWRKLMHEHSYLGKYRYDIATVQRPLFKKFLH